MTRSSVLFHRSMNALLSVCKHDRLMYRLTSLPAFQCLFNTAQPSKAMLCHLWQNECHWGRSVGELSQSPGDEYHITFFLITEFSRKNICSSKMSVSNLIFTRPLLYPNFWVVSWFFFSPVTLNWFSRHPVSTVLSFSKVMGFFFDIPFSIFCFVDVNHGDSNIRAPGSNPGLLLVPWLTNCPVCQFQHPHL